ncbi:MAG: efflux RND transporter periplasmic adaptor subunit [Candidatus Zixiibacteriota bacterium]
MKSEKTSIIQQWRKRVSQRRTVVAIVVMAIAAAMATGFWLRGSRPAKTSEAASEENTEARNPNIVVLDIAAQRNIDLALETAQTRTIMQTIQTTGSVGPNETRVAHIRPLARGQIEEVYVRLGDRVRAGQPLVAYDNIELGELISEYLIAVAALEKANAEAEVTKRSLERAQNLVDLGAVARAEYERRNAEYKNALASINSEKAEVAKIEEKLHRFGLIDADLEKFNTLTHSQYHREASHSILRAPFDGIIIKYDVAAGEVVETERELFTIADLSTVWVQADVYEKDISSIHRGQEVKIIVDAYPGETFFGKISYVSDFLDPKTRTAKVRCEVPNHQGRLKLEMFATIQIPSHLGREAVMIPTTAVQQIDDKPVVFIKISDSEFQKRDAQLGFQSDGWVEIKSGLKAGEIVATQGSFYLKSSLLREQIGGEEGH